jgi:hypothetical protein
MTNQQKISGTMHVILWAVQIVLAALLLAGAIMKFMPIEKISEMMPWTGQVPVWMVRILGIVDLVGAAGLVLPGLLRIKPQLTSWAALGIITLMLCAIIFHVSRGEGSVVEFNVFCVALAGFVGWGRFKKSKEGL